ncbi:class I SAM-dependent methyltransferase [Streptomyces sp. G45]|uniref:class I SAM-dependent methyltransferase n=1 Tax=Streptomyces sp. G45 TaxID=3406627 RepID=UPI003C266323
MTYEHPLAYLIGVQGIALLRSLTGDVEGPGGRAFVEARLGEVRKLLDDERLAGAAVDVARVGTVDGYGIWSATYDGPNAAFALDTPLVEEVVGELPPGRALDAACGTGRIAVLLAGHGHEVTGVDSSPAMLARARERVPGGVFLEGDVRALPVADGVVDLVTCSLALTHVPDLAPVFAEFARVLRPGGHLVVSDVHPERVARGVIPPVRLPDGRPGRLASHRHLVGDYLRAALPRGLRVLRCEEPGVPPAEDPEGAPGASAAPEPGPWDLWPWSLAALAPEATAAADAGTPAALVWHFQLDGA